MKEKRTTYIVCIIALIGAIMVMPASAQLADTPWSMYQHDLNHTGLSPYTGPDTNATKWTYSVGGYSSPPVIGADGTLYVGRGITGFGGGYLCAINPNGTLKWEYGETSGPLSDCGAAVGSDGTVYTGNCQYSGMPYGFCAINPNGTRKWKCQMGDSSSYSRPAIGSDGTIYIGCDDDHLYAIKPDGTLKWKFLTGHDVRSSPAIGSDGTIYVGSKDKKLYAVNPDGTLKWSYETGGYIYNGASPAIGSDGTIYVGSKDENLHAINPNGTGKWKYKTGGRIYCTPAIGADGTIYVGSKDKKLYAITDDGTHGTLKWSYETGDGIWRTSPAIDAVGTIYIGSRDKKFYAINPDGTLKWSYETGDIIQWSAPAIGSDGTVYIGSGDGKLYAFGPGQAPCGCVGEHYTFTCGMEVNESCVFNCDMSCPAGHGLVIGSDDIIIDGAGYTIDGVSPATCENADRAGISGTTTNEPRDNVTIKNMEIKNFCCGIHLEGFGALGKFTNVTIDNCTIHDNGVNITARKTHGIKAIKVHDSTIENCKIYNNTGGTGCTPPCENGGSGIFLKIGDDNVITNNEIYDNKKGGFFCKASPKRCEISHNEIWGNHQGGLILRCKCTQNFTIEYNNASCNYGTGIFIGGPCNTIRHNNVSNNMNGAIETLPDTGTNGCGVNFGRDDVGDCGYAPCGSMGSRLNTLINNTICDNEYRDIWERAAVRGTNNGVENKCDEPDGWNDDGTSGCTYPCVVLKSDLVIRDKSEAWINDTHFNVNYKVCNIGEGDADASEATLYVDGTDVEHQFTPTLDAGTCTDEMTFTTEVECPCGETVNITVCADNGEVIDESDETNNCEVNMVECPSCAKPDLVIEDKHETWINEAHFNISYKVCNIGGEDAGASEATLYIDGTDVEHQDTPALDAGACTDEMTFTTEVECPCGETINITVCADNGEIIDESDETNNCKVNIVECPPCPEMPDLVISEKHEEWINFNEKTYNVTYTVNNIGEGPAGASTTSIKIDGTEEATDSVPVLAAGASHTAELGPFTISGNKDIISVCADKDNVVDESDEANNCMENEWKYGVETATGTGTAYFDSDTGTMEGLTAVDEATLPEEGKPDLVFKHGFFSFNITGFTGQAVNVIITLPSDLPAGTQYWKYGPTPDNHTEHWYQLPMEIIDGNKIRITLVDNGLGDDILTGEDGEIVDRGGTGSPPGVPPVAVPVYNIFGLFSLVGILSVVLAVTSMGRRKRR